MSIRLNFEQKEEKLSEWYSYVEWRNGVYADGTWLYYERKYSFIKILLLSQFYTIFVTKCKKMGSIQKEIAQKIESSKKGSIIFPADFAYLGQEMAIRQGLARLVKANKLIRLAQGIYLYPAVDAEIGIIYPSIESIAEAIARRDKARIVPSGAYALNRLGLSTQVPLKTVYMTDGTPRTLKIGNTMIDFQKTSTKVLDIKSDLLVLFVIALQSLGRDNINPTVKAKIGDILIKNRDKSIFSELHKAPTWIAQLIKNISEQNLRTHGMVQTAR